MSDNFNGPVCACTRVVFYPVRHADGSTSDRWSCPSCESRFVRADVASHDLSLATARAEKAEAEVDAIRAALPHEGRDGWSTLELVREVIDDLANERHTGKLMTDAMGELRADVERLTGERDAARETVLARDEMIDAMNTGGDVLRTTIATLRSSLDAARAVVEALPECDDGCGQSATYVCTSGEFHCDKHKESCCEELRYAPALRAYESRSTPRALPELPLEVVEDAIRHAGRVPLSDVCPGCHGTGYQSAGDDRIGTWPCPLCLARRSGAQKDSGGAATPASDSADLVADEGKNRDRAAGSTRAWDEMTRAEATNAKTAPKL